MKSRLLVLVALSALLLVLGGCQYFSVDTEEAEPDSLTLSDATVVLDEETADSISVSVDPEGELLISGTEAADYQAGTVLAIPPSDEAPLGLLRKVTGCREENGVVVAETTQATLAEAISECRIDHTLSTSDLYEPQGLLSPKIAHEQPLHKYVPIDEVIYDDDGKTWTTDDQIKLVGYIDLQLTIRFWLDIGPFTGVERAGASVDMEQSAEIEVIGDLAYSNTYEHQLPMIPLGVYWIPMTPIWLAPELTITLGVTGDGKLSFRFGVENACSYAAGAGYDASYGSNPFYPIWDDTGPTMGYTEPELDAEGTIRCYVKPELAIKICSVVGPFVNAEAYGLLEASYTLGSDICWELSAGLGVKAGLELAIDVFGFKASLPRYETDELAGIHEVIDKADACDPDGEPPDVTLQCGTPTQDGSVQFSWSGTDDRTPSPEIRYQYRLEGYESEWSSWQLPQEKSYTALPDGDYTFQVRAKDLYKNVSSIESCQVAIETCSSDRTAPVISLDCGTPTNGAVTFSWSATDNCVEQEDIWYRYMLVGWDSTFTQWSRKTTASYSGLGQKQYTFKVQAHDGQGNISPEYTCVVEEEECAVDKTHPVVELDCAAPEGTSASFSWTGSDNCTQASDILYHYRLQGVEDTYSKWGTTKSAYYTNLSPGGTYVFYVQARDQEGNISPEYKCTIQIDPCASDGTPPTVSMSCSSPNGDDISYTWSGSDNCSSSSELRYRYKLEGYNSTWSAWSTTTSKSYSNLPYGNYTFCVQARDASDNESSQRCCSFEIVDPCASDSTPPTISMSCSTPDGDDISFNWSATDDCTSNSSIQYRYRLIGLSSTWSSWSTSASKSYTNLSDGSYAFCVEARDTKGNVSPESCCSFQVDPCVTDSTPPVLTLPCSEPSGDDISFNWSATDDCTSIPSIQYQYRLLGYNSTWSSWSTSTSKSYSNLSDGSYAFCVEARDTKGNVAPESCCPFQIGSTIYKLDPYFYCDGMSCGCGSIHVPAGFVDSETQPNGHTTYFYEAGHVVVLTASGQEGWTFSHWSGDASGTSSSISIVMNRDKAVAAHFDPTPPLHILQTSVVGSGTVDCVCCPLSDYFGHGDLIRLVAHPSSGWEFSHWSGDASGASTELEITMDRDKSVIAHFVTGEEWCDHCVPTLLNPAPNAEFTIMTGIIDDTPTVEFEWTSVQGATDYRIELQNLYVYPNTRWVPWPEGLREGEGISAAGATRFFWEAAGAGDWRWRVWAIGPDGSAGAASAWRSFYVWLMFVD